MIKTQGGFLVSRIKHLSGRIFEKMLKQAGVDVFNGAQGRILYVLWEHEILSISEIGKLTSLAKTTLTGMLDRMEQAGLVQRNPDKDNRRQIYITITEKAKMYYKKYIEISNEMSDLFYKGFSDEEIVYFETSLKKILSNLEAKEEIQNEENIRANQ